MNLYDFLLNEDRIFYGVMTNQPICAMLTKLTRKFWLIILVII